VENRSESVLGSQEIISISKLWATRLSHDSKEKIMNNKFTHAVCITGIMLQMAGQAVAQGSFQNLNFEAANVPNVPPLGFGSDVPTTDGVPGWVVYLGGIPQSSMLHNNVSLGAAEVAIYGPQWFASQILEGNYTVALQPSTAGPSTSASIGQTGLIPQTAESFSFYGNGGFVVTFNGHEIPLTTLGSGANYTVLAGDISAFAGQTAELLFQGGGLLDNIQFSNLPVPEPSVLGLSALGALLLGWCVIRRRR
jgi:hypothetical protein